jgi:hypothetical protein
VSKRGRERERDEEQPQAEPVVNETEHAGNELSHAIIKLLKVGLLSLLSARVGELLDGLQRLFQEVEVL